MLLIEPVGRCCRLGDQQPAARRRQHQHAIDDIRDPQRLRLDRPQHLELISKRTRIATTEISHVLDAFHLEGLKLFLLYLGLSLAMLAGFIRLYIWSTPYHEPAEIANGNIAAAIALAGAMLGFTFPLLVASYSRSSVFGFIAWAALACFVQLLLFRVMYWLMPSSIESKNVASATCFAAGSICVGLINAASFLP